jgi:hypothetical protein
MDSPAGYDNSLVLSYMGLRKAIGIIGTTLPFALALGLMLLSRRAGVEVSISAYYYTRMGDVFVGSLCAVAVFLMSYRGYERRDRVAGVAACVFGVGIALFPTAPDAPTAAQARVGIVHHVFAASFFLALAYFSLALFRKTDPTKPPTRQKVQRNVVYTVCGYTILACLAILVVARIVIGEPAMEALKLLFVFESVAIVAFGISWLTKGEFVLKDQ